MESQIFLITSTVCIVLVSFYLIYLMMETIKTLKTIRLVVADLQSTTEDIRRIKNSFKFGLMGILYKFLGGKNKEGGDFDER